MLTLNEAKAFRNDNTWFRINMPYQYMPLSVGLPNVYLPVNRLYKPLGVSKTKWITYEEYLEQAVAFAKPISTFEGVWWPCAFGGSGVGSMYNDSTESRKTYFERIERLMLKKQRPALSAINDVFTGRSARKSIDLAIALHKAGVLTRFFPDRAELYGMYLKAAA